MLKLKSLAKFIELNSLGRIMNGLRFIMKKKSFKQNYWGK